MRDQIQVGSLQLGTALTGADDVFPVTNLSTIEEWPEEQIETARYDGRVLREWGERAEDVEGPVEVSVVPMEYEHGEGSALMLVAKVPDSDVVVCAAPLDAESEEGDDE